MTLRKIGLSFLLLGLVALIGSASAADFTRQPGNGAWNDPNLWSPVGVPGASDNARIESTAGDITFTASATVGLLDVAGTYTGTIALGSYTLTTSQVSFAGGTFNGETGALVCNGSFAIAGGVFNAPPALTFKGNVAIPSGTFSHGNGAALFAANYQAAQTIAAGTAVFNHVTIKGNSISVTTIQDDLHVDGELSFETTSYSGCTLNGGRILAKKNVTMASSGVGTWDHPGNAWLVLCGTADQTLHGATSGRFTNIRIDKPSGILQLAGTPLVFGSWDWVNADGLNAGTSAVTFATPYNTVVAIKGGPVSYGDVTFKGWGQFSKHDLVGDLQIGGDLTLDVVAYSGNQVNGASFIVAGDVIMNNAGFGSASWGPGNSTIKLTGSGSHAIIANSSGHFPNMFIDTTGSVTTVGDVTVGGNWTFVNGTFTQGAGTLEFQAPYGATRTILPGTVSYGNVTITGNGLSNQSVAGTLHVAGKFILASAGYTGAKLNDGVVEVGGDFELPGDGFGASDGGPGSAVIRLAGTGNQTVTAGGLSRCPTLEIDTSGTVTFVAGMRFGAHYLHTSGSVNAAGSTQTFVGRASTLITGAAVFGDLVIHKGPYGSAYAVTLEGAAQASGGLTVAEGILKFADNASLSVAGHVEVGAANVGITAGANSALTLNGSAAQNVNLAGKTVFNLNVVNTAGAINFTAPYTAQGTTSAVPGATLVFASGSTFNAGKLAMNGTQTQGIALRASTTGSAAGIVAAPYQFVRYAEIADLNAASGPKVVALHSTDGGNNQNIIFQAAALLNLAAGNTSVTSPAWVEGISGPDVTSLTVALNGEAPFPASRLNPTQYYGSNQASGHALGIELSASAATNVEVAASNAFGESNTATQNIAWAATDLAGKSYSTDQLKIRINSKLRFVLDNHDSNVGETVRIDTNNDGTFEYTGVEGESIEHLFNASGSVIVRGEIGGLAVGSLTVIVVDTNLHGPVACQKGYERGLDVFALPATEAANITYAAADPYALGLTVTQVTGDGALLKLKPATMDSPAFVSRLGDATGPIIDIQPLLVFTVTDLNSHILGFAIDSTGYGRAIARYQITPRTVIDNDNPVTTAQEGLYFDLGCLGTDMVFAENGQSTLRVHSNRQDADGIFEVETLLAPTGTFVCHSIQPRQINSNYTVGDYLYHNPCVMKAAGGLYLHREMSDETTREGKTNLYPEGHNEAGKQIFQVWDQDPQIDGRWTSEIEVNDFTPQAMEAAFFAEKARKKVLPNRHFTVKVEQPGNSFLFAVRMQPGTTGIKGGADIDDNTGVDRDEILHEREPSQPENYLKWTGGYPSAYPALNLPPNHWGHDYQDKSKQYKSWDSIFFRYYPHPWYTDIGFWKGNMIGKMTVWGTCHPAPLTIPRKKVIPDVRPGLPGNPHTNTEAGTLSPFWLGEETEFRDILKFGRLEADGYLETDIPASGSGQSSTTADISSRNAFPDVVGANVFEVQKEIQVPDPNNPGQTMPKTETYLRTQHEGSTGTASPVPVQITFRAPPGQAVRVGVALARRAEKDNPSTPANEIDHDGKKTHRAWVHLSNTAILESRGQPEDNDDVKAGKVVEITAFDQDGNITQEKPAERVVKFSMTANNEWFASQIVYVYGIEPSENLDDLKLVVWGEEIMDWKAYPKEVQTHHYENNEKDPDCPIKRWYITDEEPVSIVKLEIVVPASTTEDGKPQPSAARALSQIAPVSEPHPTVTLNEVREYDITITGETALVKIEGFVHDSIADNTPRGKVSTGRADIDRASILLDGVEIGSSDVVATTDGAAAFWRQHPYKGHINQIETSVPIVGGTREITVKTSLNAAGYEGRDSLVIGFASNQLPGGLIGAVNTVTANIFLPNNPSASANDTLQYYFGSREPIPEDPIFTESVDSLASDHPFSIAVTQAFSASNIDIISLLLKPRKLPIVSIELTGMLNPLVADQIILHTTSASFVLTEDGPNTKIFTGTNVNFGAVTLNLNEITNLNPAELDKARGIVSFSGPDLYNEVIPNVGQEPLSFFESALNSNVLNAYREVVLSEDAPSSLTFGAQVIDLGAIKVSIPNYTSLSPAIADNFDAWITIPKLWLSAAPFSMTESLSDSRFFVSNPGSTVAANTLVFYGKVENISSKITLNNFNGLTSNQDVFEGEVAYLFSDGGVSTLRAQFTETEPLSNLFRATFHVTAGTVDTPQRIWSVASVSNLRSSALVSYIPMAVRFKSIAQPIPFGITLNEFPNLIGLEGSQQDDSYYMEGGSVNIVVVAADPDDSSKVIIIYYDKDLHEVLKFKLDRDAVIKWKLARKDNPLLKLASTDATILKIDLSVDANRNGSPDDGLDDDKGEDTWEFGLGNKGAVVLNNIDDDDPQGPPNPAHIVDNGNGSFGTTDANKVNGVDDANDLAPLVIRQVSSTKMPVGWKAFLKVSDKNYIRIFNSRLATAIPVIGPSQSNQYEIPDPTQGDLVFGMEGIDYPDEGFDGKIDVQLILKDQNGQVRAKDDVQVRVAPWLMLDNLKEPERVFVVRLGAPAHDNAAFRAALRAAVPATIPITEIDGAAYSDDRWTQDQFEIGFSQTPFGLPSVAFNSPRDRGLSSYAQDALLGPDFGLFNKGFDTETGSSFGNLEVSFPVTVGSKEYKFGRIVHGNNMDPVIKKFLKAQRIQAPISVDTDWLRVGHVDEVFSFINTCAGPKVLLASPGRAIEILRQLQGDGKGSVKLFAGKQDPEIGGVAGRTVDEILGNAQLLDYNVNAVFRKIEDIRKKLRIELNLAAEDFVEVPVLFFENSGHGLTGASALTGNMVNLLVTGTTLAVPDPFGPMDGAVDKFKESFMNSPAGCNTLHFIDCWDRYHLQEGENHCGTNAKRRPESQLFWWEQKP